ncbi:hypothetical protein [Psychrobacillus vulpis]|uniref:Uncharacterized protein n=1 Tax=Psychrobacillus vulpis TaxID=2325572 RepID=A0A544TT92_9BACI|nr:hypothetical protein [Psychrobacillus vulpis]TQR20659.1 hypothetical protein FG384_06070 [Psychrobacillus vulpis]
MIVNNGANLSKEYFISYLRLVMKARSYSLESAKIFMQKSFFKESKEIYGIESYNNFIRAIEDLKT